MNFSNFLLSVCISSIDLSFKDPWKYSKLNFSDFFSKLKRLKGIALADIKGEFPQDHPQEKGLFDISISNNPPFK